MRCPSRIEPEGHALTGVHPLPFMAGGRCIHCLVWQVGGASTSFYGRWEVHPLPCMAGGRCIHFLLWQVGGASTSFLTSGRCTDFLLWQVGGAPTSFYDRWEAHSLPFWQVGGAPTSFYGRWEAEQLHQYGLIAVDSKGNAMQLEKVEPSAIISHHQPASASIH